MQGLDKNYASIDSMRGQVDKGQTENGQYQNIRTFFSRHFKFQEGTGS